MGGATKKKMIVDSDDEEEEQYEDADDGDSSSSSSDEEEPTQKKSGAPKSKPKKPLDDDDSSSSSDGSSSSDISSSSDSDSDSDSDDKKKKKKKLTKKNPAKKSASKGKKMSIAEAAAAASNEDEDEEEMAGTVSPKKSKEKPVPSEKKKDSKKSEKKEDSKKSEKKEDSKKSVADDEEDMEDGDGDDDEEQDEVDAEALEAAKKEVHRTTAWYVVRDGDHEIRVVAVQRADLCFGNDKNVKTILNHTDDYFKSTAILVLPGDVAEAVGVEGGIVKARGLSKHSITSGAKRLVDMGLRRSGTMAFPPAYVFDWIRSLETVPEEDIARVESALADPEMYEESDKSAMRQLGPAKVPRVDPNSTNGSASSAKKKKRSSSSRKRKADAPDEGEERSLKHGRVASDHGLVLFLNVLGHCLVEATEKFNSNTPDA